MGYREKIPKKITPDRIKESLVHIGCESPFNFPVSVGYFHSLFLDAGYTHQANSGPRDRHQIFLHYFFHEKKGVSVVITPQGVTFNCIEKYIGWSVFGEEIVNLITRLFEKNVILRIHQVGIRYVSEFPGSDLFENLDFSVSSSVFSDNNRPGRVCLEKVEDDYKIIINLIITEYLRPFTKAAKSSSELSIIDVDVIRKNLNIEGTADFEKLLNEAHQKEKQIFFSLLNNDFLTTLNPEY